MFSKPMHFKGMSSFANLTALVTSKSASDQMFCFNVRFKSCLVRGGIVTRETFEFAVAVSNKFFYLRVQIR